MPTATTAREKLPLDVLTGIQNAAAAALATAAVTLRPDGQPLMPPTPVGLFYQSLAKYPSGLRWLLEMAAPAAKKAVEQHSRVSLPSSTGISVVAFPYVIGNTVPATLVIFTTAGVKKEFAPALADDLGLPPGALPAKAEPFDKDRAAAALRLVDQCVLLLERSSHAGNGRLEAEVRRSRVLTDATRALSLPMNAEAVLDTVTDYLAGILHMESGIPYERTEDGWEPGNVFHPLGPTDSEPPPLALEPEEQASLEHGHLVTRHQKGPKAGTIILVPLVSGELEAVISLRARQILPPVLAADEDLALTVARQATAYLRNARHVALQRSLAHTLQNALQSRLPIAQEGISVMARYTPAAREANVGGDFYDVFTLPDGRVAALVGDVAGKGVPAAIHTNLVRYTLRSYALLSPDPGEILERTNNALVDNEEFGDFVSMVLVVLDPKAGRLQYANAGHCPILHYRRRADAAGFLASTGTLLGISRGQAMATRTEKWEPGDQLLLFTDGISEAHPTGSYELFELEGVKSTFMAHRNETPDRIVQGLYQAALDYSGGVLHDDCALLLLGRADNG